MSEYKDLIKNFDKLRDYMRDFFIYGLKTRKGYAQKSPRTYDNERRRIEGYLKPYIVRQQDKAGKRLGVTLDTGKITGNPLYAAYGCKSFTDKDITLHFLLLAILEANTLTLEEIADVLYTDYDCLFETQTIRLKLKEYATLGILVQGKRGRAATYTLAKEGLYSYLPQAKAAELLAFFSEAAPFGQVGHYLMEQYDLANDKFTFKHHYIAQALDDQILLTVLQAIEEKRLLKFTNFSQQKGALMEFIATPLKILTSSQNGRRYMLAHKQGAKGYSSFRLDYIKAATLGEPDPEYIGLQVEQERLQQKAWGTLYSSKGSLEVLVMKLYVDEATEQFILERLQREKRIGVLTKTAPGLYTLTITALAAAEALSWVKSFTCRLIAVECTNKEVEQLFYEDFKRLQQLYSQPTGPAVEPHR